ncbi:MAG: hypothetical protein ACLFTZ_03915, partial [Acholeplasmataceae bacterium]
MRFSELIGIKRVVKSRARIYTLGVIITGILSVMVSIITFYGQNTGNFTMSLDEDAAERGIELSVDSSFADPTTRLMMESVEDAKDMTYAWIDFEGIRETDGQFVDIDPVTGNINNRYIAYSFYLRNSGLETVDIDYYTRISEVLNDMDEAVRFLIIEDDEIERMYQKPDEPDDEGNPPTYYQMPEGNEFESSAVVFRERIINFKPNDVKRFSVVIWLEGQDPDTTDDILGGKIRANMNFTITGAEEEDS